MHIAPCPIKNNNKGLSIVLSSFLLIRIMIQRCDESLEVDQV